MVATIEDMRNLRRGVQPLDARFDEFADETPQFAGHVLDNPKNRMLLKKLQEWWNEARTAHSENRFQQSIDADFYDGLQWDDRDAEILRERGQAPLVFNKTAQHINWILGTERRTRVDFNVLPRKDHHEQIAKSKTKLLKYVSDVNKGQFARSRSFSDAMKVGVGWLEDGIRSDPRDEPLFSRYEHWRNMWWDALAKEPHLQDGRYIFRVKWADTDVAEAMFPERKDVLQRTARHSDLNFFEDDDDFSFTSLYADHRTSHPVFARGRSFLDTSFNIGNRRKRNKLIECWYRKPVSAKFLRSRPHALMQQDLLDQLDQINGLPFDADDENQKKLIDSALASTFDAVEMQVWVAIFTGDHFLQNVQSPYKHNRFPFTPIWAYRRDRDGMPYGPIRNMRDAQEDLNKRKSKALFILSTNQLIGDEDAFEDWDEAIDEAARPDGVLKHKRGATFEINRNIDLAQEHVDLMRDDITFLESASGVTEENLGEVTNTNSGTAINLRQTQGSVVTAMLFDNLRESIQLEGELQLSLVEQFYAEPKMVRIVDDSGRTDFLGINQMQRDDEGRLSVLNPITESQADFIVDTQDFRETIRLAMFDQLMEMTTRLDPQVTMQILDLIIDLSDLPGKDEIVRRIRKINGMTDPDDPNRDKIEADRAEQDQEDADRDRRATDAKTRKDESMADKSLADAAGMRAETVQAALEIVAALKGDKNLAQAVDIMMASVQSESTDTALSATAAGVPAQTLEIETPFDQEDDTQASHE
jgi:hypothetical protein